MSDDPIVWVPRDLEDAEGELARREQAVEAHDAMIVRRLRDVADTVAKGNDALHAVPWGIANLNLDSLARLRGEREYMRGVVAKYKADAAAAR